jgi:hypothetical protein
MGSKRKNKIEQGEQRNIEGKLNSKLKPKKQKQIKGTRIKERVGWKQGDQEEDKWRIKREARQREREKEREH